jgi:hypothetical protein
VKELGLAALDPTYAVIVTADAGVKFLLSAFLLISSCALAAAQGVPLPRARPTEPSSAQPSDPSASACRQRLTESLALAPSLPAIEGPGDCGADDVVRLEAVVLASRAHVAVTPPAVLRCTFAEEIVRWVREDLVPAARAFKLELKAIDNYAAYDCRGRNRVLGARISEHGRGNALDVRSLKLSDGKMIGLADRHASRELREGLRKKTCARFATVLGPGSDGYHEDHIHVDLAERRGGAHMCQWDIREPEEESGEAVVPLPRPRPNRG